MSSLSSRGLKLTSPLRHSHVRDFYGRNEPARTEEDISLVQPSGSVWTRRDAAYKDIDKWGGAGGGPAHEAVLKSPVKVIAKEKSKKMSLVCDLKSVVRPQVMLTTISSTKPKKMKMKLDDVCCHYRVTKPTICIFIVRLHAATSNYERITK